MVDKNVLAQKNKNCSERIMPILTMILFCLLLCSCQKKAVIALHSNLSSDSYSTDELSVINEDYQDALNCYGTLYMDLFSVTLVKLIHTTYSLVGGIIIFSIIATARVPGGWGWKTPKVF